jgi:hypothetical protein
LCYELLFRQGLKVDVNGKNVVQDFLFFQQDCSQKAAKWYLQTVIRNIFLISILICSTSCSFGQGTFFERSDTLNKKRLLYISGGTGIGWVGSMSVLYGTWYSKQNLGTFHSYDDSRNWLQMDKIGHVYTAWQINSLTSSMFRWTGLTKKNVLLISSSVAWGYQATLEVFDGLSEDWGFSWSDLASNTAGVIGFTVQEIIWNEQRFLPKFSYHPTEFAAYRPAVLGSSFSERLLKDYNGQTYWLSFSTSTFFENGRIPKWLCISIGYSAHARLYGDQDLATLENEGTISTFDSSREWLMSLDIDLSRIPVKKLWLKTVFKQLNYLKIPFPALLLREGKLHGIPLYF